MRRNLTPCSDAQKQSDLVMLPCTTTRATCPLPVITTGESEGLSSGEFNFFYVLAVAPGSEFHQMSFPFVAGNCGGEPMGPIPVVG